jgi:hypothetical protein
MFHAPAVARDWRIDSPGIVSSMRRRDARGGPRSHPSESARPKRPPAVDGKLAGDQPRAGIDSLIEDLEQIGPVSPAMRGQTQVVEDHEQSFGDRPEEFGVADIAVCDA